MQTPDPHILLVLLYGYLLAVVLVVAVIDFRHRRIPNLATYSTVVLALLLHTLAGGVAGLLFSLQGLLLGLCLLVLPYLLGGMGAGDVKLMAAVGAVLGASQTFVTFLFVAVLGGITALAMLVARKEVRAALGRIGLSLKVLCGGAGLSALQVDRATLRRDTIPYGAVIAGGTVLFFVYRMVAGGGLPGAAV